MDDTTFSSASASSWNEFASDAADLAAAVRAQFEARKHHILATVRRDGSPRVSGTEVQFHRDQLVIGMMFGSVKALDLRRDGRFAVHAAMIEPMGSGPGGGDIKLSGTALEITDPTWLADYVEVVQPPPPFHVFQLLLREVIRTSLHPDGDRIVIERWTPIGKLTRIERS